MSEKAAERERKKKSKLWPLSENENFTAKKKRRGKRLEQQVTY